MQTISNTRLKQAKKDLERQGWSIRWVTPNKAFIGVEMITNKGIITKTFNVETKSFII